ncbi:hypothetical protein ACFUGD_01780 [Streptomyces sp. NPDC057217]|uniref:hypothetical protein n=1 Tax=Streptomyces sp. NPDC057217 TaxID=3346054 RepID=UPI0036341027
MSTSYRNTNTGDIATYDEPNARLEALPNWERVEDGKPLPAIVNDGVLSRPTLTAPGVHDLSYTGPATNEELRKESPAGAEGAESLATTENGEPSATRPPAKNASKAEWQEYAQQVETDPEAQSDIEGLTKEQLVEKYGRGDG